MLKMLKEILKTGDATVKYPFAPLPERKDTRGKPEHDAVRCMACAACAVACPPNAIRMQLDLEGGTISWTIDYGRCIFCGRCEEVCPAQAIKLTPVFELAVMTRSDLTEECIYALDRCEVCGRYFAPHKEVAYARTLLSGGEAGPAVDDALASLAICPTCKQTADAHRAQRRTEVGGR